MAATFDYLSRMGDWCYAVDRWEGGGEPTRDGTRPRHIPKEKRILYRANEISDGDDPVVILESEHRADLLVDMGYTATACLFGLASWLPQYADGLRGRDVVVLLDATGCGRQSVENIMRSLRGVAVSIHVATVVLPAGGPGEDRGVLVDVLGGKEAE